MEAKYKFAINMFSLNKVFQREFVIACMINRPVHSIDFLRKEIVSLISERENVTNYEKAYIIYDALRSLDPNMDLNSAFEGFTYNPHKSQINTTVEQDFNSFTDNYMETMTPNRPFSNATYIAHHFEVIRQQRMRSKIIT